MKRKSMLGQLKNVSPVNLGKIVNALMDGVAPKKIGFDFGIALHTVYYIKASHSLFCGMVNPYKRH